MTTRSVIHSAALAALACLAPLAAGAEEPRETQIYNFGSQPQDGGGPVAKPLAGPGGVLYGTTAFGPGHNQGTIYRLTPPASGENGPWTETVLYSFTGGADGRQPITGLVADHAGALYGTTVFGGSHLNGVAFKLSPPTAPGNPWTETVIYDFLHFRANPSGLVLGPDGGLFGTTLQGGLEHGCGGFGCGAVFKLFPPTPGHTNWTLKVLHAFTGHADGSFPSWREPPIRDAHGALYGTTENGGNFSAACVGGMGKGCGTVYKLTPPTTPGGAWTETVLYAFTGTTDGAFPLGSVIMDASGALYGTTSAGPGASGLGTVFKLTPPAPGQTQWTETVLHTFENFPDGSTPFAGVTMDATGALYGTTEGGGHAAGGNGCGTLFMLTPPAAGQTNWTDTVLHRFFRRDSQRDGCVPLSGVIVHRDALIGATFNGGIPGGGVVYEYRFNP
jgi:hypothetical protein